MRPLFTKAGDTEPEELPLLDINIERPDTAKITVVPGLFFMNINV